MQDDRRRFPRYQIEQMVKIAFNNIETVSYVKGLNISKSGILCEVDQKIDMDEKIYFVISLPGDAERKIEIQAQVVRVEEVNNSGKFLIALVFLLIEEGNKKVLNSYIDSIAKEN